MAKTDFSALWAKANATGTANAALATPDPMTVVSGDGLKAWFVADGVCGFGWVHFSGKTAFGKWAKAAGIARPDYPKGLAVWSPLRTQSLARNEAWAEGVAAVLREFGIDAVGRSRID